MILKIGDTDVSDYVTVGYSVKFTPVYDTAFTAMDGTEHKPVKCTKGHISADVAGLDAATAAELMQAATGSDTVDVVFGSPGVTSAQFHKAEATAEMVIEDPEQWDIHLDIESVALYCL